VYILAYGRCRATSAGVAAPVLPGSHPNRSKSRQLSCHAHLFLCFCLFRITGIFACSNLSQQCRPNKLEILGKAGFAERSQHALANRRHNYLHSSLFCRLRHLFGAITLFFSHGSSVCCLGHHKRMGSLCNFLLGFSATCIVIIHHRPR